jgi:flagellar L-ring protein precursor FlgH
MNHRCTAALSLALTCSTASAQSLSDQLKPKPVDDAAVAVATPTQVQQTSLIAVIPPPPRTYQKHDLIEVIINETSVQSFEQSLDSSKKYDIMAELVKFPSIRNLLEAQLVNGDDQSLANLNIGHNRKFAGEGEFERKDKVQARLTAIVLDVKPNGTLVLEARESIQSDDESSTMVLSGICRSEDVSKLNSVQSAQLANLTIRIEHDGDVRESAKKGIIPQVLETIFNF